MRLWLIVHIAILLVCCKKELHNEPTCNGIPYSLDFSKFKLITTDTFYHAPYCSPINADEFYFVKENPNFNDGLQLCYYNIRTHRKKTFEVGVVGVPVVSSNGWLAFTRIDLRLWKMKANGDSLQQITNSVGDDEQQPAWSPDGKRLVYLHHSTPFYKEVMINSDGTDIHTIDSSGVFLYPDWSPDGRKIAFSASRGSEEYCAYYDIATSKVVRLAVVGRSVVWDKDSKWLYFIKDDGIYKINIITSEVIKLKDACKFHIYDYMSLTADGKNIIAGIEDRSLADPNTIRHRMYICRMDSMGRNEEEVKF